MDTNFKWKLAGIVGVVAILAGLLVIIKYQHDALKKLEETQTSILEQKKVGDTTRAEKSLATQEDLDNLAAELDLNLDPIKADLKTLGANVNGIQVTKVITQGTVIKEVASTTTEARPANEPINPAVVGTDPFGYQNSTQVLKLEEPFSNQKVPLGDVRFSAWRDKPWDVTIKGRKYSVINVLGQDEDGKHYTYSKFSIDVDGKSYNVDVSQNKLVEEYPENKFRLNPILNLGIDFGTYVSNPEFEMVPNLQVTLFSYGKTKILPEWTFLGLGVGYEMNRKNLNFVLSPVDYNVGEIIPLVRNLYIGPTVGYDVKGSFSVLGGIRVQL